MPVMASSAGIPASNTLMPGAGQATSARWKITPSATQRVSAMTFRMCRPGSSSGLLPILPRSLPKAITEPLKVTAPTRMPTKISPRCAARSAASTPAGCR